MNDVAHMVSALIASQGSHCVSTKVGAVIVMDDKIISYGNNNVPNPGLGTKCSCVCGHMLNDDGKLKASERPNHSAWSSSNEIHAEMAAIMNAHIQGIKLENATLYTTASPCDNCAKHIELYASCMAITRVVYLDKYSRGNDDWIKKIGKYAIIQKMERRDIPYIDFGKLVISNNE